MKSVLALRSKVKAMTETPSETMIVRAFLLFHLDSPPDDSEPPTITGSKGRMHGASTVRTPAINEIARSNILLHFSHEVGEGRTTTPLLD